MMMLAILVAASACVSVNIKPKAGTKSKDYTYSEPRKPFQKLDQDPADVAWQSPESGNTIAVLSECSETRDPSLTSLEGETIQALNKYQVTKTVNFQYQGRDALRSSVEGSLDGIPVSMDVLTFKKNSCNYTLTYVGRTQGFEKDRPQFEEFLKGFQAQ